MGLAAGGLSPFFRAPAERKSLSKDDVIVKLMRSVDEYVAEVIAELLVKPGDGVPWFTLTKPDGRIRATSEGLLGNTGSPSPVEGVRPSARGSSGRPGDSRPTNWTR